MSFLKKRQGSDFDCLKPSCSYTELSFRHQFIDTCTSPYRCFRVLMPNLRLCVQILQEIGGICCLLLVLLVECLCEINMFSF
jgi:hypothetical protein